MKPRLDTADEERQIRAIRLASNAAIESRDISTLHGSWLPDLHVTASTGEVFSSGQAMADAFTQAFQDPEFIAYKRTPESIEISTIGPLAAELGRWVGSWRKTDGILQITGRYMAQWRKTDRGWKIRSEVFVPLNRRRTES